MSCAYDELLLDRTGDATGLVFLDGAGDGAGSTLLAYACASVGASIGCDCALAHGMGSYGSNFLDPSLSSLAFNLAGRFRSSSSLSSWRSLVSSVTGAADADGGRYLASGVGTGGAA